MASLFYYSMYLCCITVPYLFNIDGNKKKFNCPKYFRFYLNKILTLKSVNCEKNSYNIAVLFAFREYVNCSD